MQGGGHFYPPIGGPRYADQAGSNYMPIPVPSASGAVFPPCAKPLPPLHDVEFQPLDVCPANYIILDQTNQGSHIMFNPAIAHNFGAHGLDFCANYAQYGQEMRAVYNGEKEMSSSLKEDSADIDALLNSEYGDEDEEEEYDEEEVSTARTCGNYRHDSPNSCSTPGSKPRRNQSSSSLRSYSDDNCNNEKKRLKMKKMVKVLRGILPGGEQMDTVSVLDEAVLYLKSLKVEAQKLGVGNLNN